MQNKQLPKTGRLFLVAHSQRTECPQGTIARLKSTIPFFCRNPFATRYSFLLLRFAVGFNSINMHLEPRSLLQVPTAIKVENMIGFDRSGACSCSRMLARLLLDLAQGALQQGFARFDFAFWQVPSAVAKDKEHISRIVDHHSACSANPTHAALEASKDSDGNIKSMIFITQFHCSSNTSCGFPFCPSIRVLPQSARANWLHFASRARYRVSAFISASGH